MLKPAKPKANVPKQEIAKGTKHEKEHTNSKVIARKIAIDHLNEYPTYYKALPKMEKNIKKRGKKA